MPEVQLRPVAPADLPLFFAHQRDPVASHMAAFGSATPDDRVAFDAHWSHLLGNPNIVVRSIVCGDGVVGHVVSYASLSISTVPSTAMCAVARRAAQHW